MTHSIWVVTGVFRRGRSAHAIFLNAEDAALFVAAYPIKEPRVIPFNLKSWVPRSGHVAHVSLDALNAGAVLYVGPDWNTAIRYARRGLYPTTLAWQFIPIDPLVNETRRGQFLYRIPFRGSKPVSATRVVSPMLNDDHWFTGNSARWSGSEGGLDLAWALAGSEAQAIEQVMGIHGSLALT